MNKTDVVLVYPPDEFSESNAKDLHSYRINNKKMGVWPPLGLLYLVSALENKSISCQFIDAFVQGFSLRRTLKEIKKFSPKVVAISVTTLQIRAAVQLGEAIKERFKNIKIIVGGPHISIDQGFVHEFSCFDVGMTGEAEITFPKVIEKILKGKAVPKIVNSQLPLDLDRLPLPARNKIKISDYFEVESPMATIITSRGCPYKCLFCSRVAISDKVRFRNPELIVDEIESLKPDYQNITFLDDTFTLNRNHTLSLCREMIKRDLKMRWTCNTRANLLDEELVKAMKDAGCDLILIGVESGDEKLRNETIHKKIKDKDVNKAVRICKKAGVTIGGYFMLGFPKETEGQIEKTVNYPGKFGLDIMSIHATTVYPGSELFETAQKENKKNYLDLWYKYAKGEKRLQDLPLVYIPKGMEFSVIEKARKKAYLKFYARPKFIIKQIIRDLKSFNDFKRDFFQALMLLRFGKTSKDLK